MLLAILDFHLRTMNITIRVKTFRWRTLGLLPKRLWKKVRQLQHELRWPSGSVLDPELSGPGFESYSFALFSCPDTVLGRATKSKKTRQQAKEFSCNKNIAPLLTLICTNYFFVSRTFSYFFLTFEGRFSRKFAVLFLWKCKQKRKQTALKKKKYFQWHSKWRHSKIGFVTKNKAGKCLLPNSATFY